MVALDPRDRRLARARPRRELCLREGVLEVAADLDAQGPESWIASALRHRFAFEVSWEAQDRLGMLEHFDADDLCAACGAALGVRSDDVADA